MELPHIYRSLIIFNLFQLTLEKSEAFGILKTPQYLEKGIHCRLFESVGFNNWEWVNLELHLVERSKLKHLINLLNNGFHIQARCAFTYKQNISHLSKCFISILKC